MSNLSPINSRWHNFAIELDHAGNEYNDLKKFLDKRGESVSDRFGCTPKWRFMILGIGTWELSDNLSRYQATNRKVIKYKHFIEEVVKIDEYGNS